MLLSNFFSLRLVRQITMKGSILPGWFSLSARESGFALVWEQELRLRLPMLPSHADFMGMCSSLFIQATKTFSDPLNCIVRILKRKPLTVRKFTFFPSFSRQCLLSHSLHMVSLLSLLPIYLSLWLDYSLPCSSRVVGVLWWSLFFGHTGRITSLNRI